MMPVRSLRCFIFILACAGMLVPALVAAQWANQPGQTVRNDFGPLKGETASMCRGACGLGCPKACKERTVYELPGR